MKYLLQILAKNRASAALYLALGLVCSYLGTVSAPLLQRVLDSFLGETLTANRLILYGLVLGLQIILEYVDNDPDVRLPSRVYLGFKLLALEKLEKIAYRNYAALGTGGLIQQVENGAQAGKGILVDFWLRMARELLPAIAFSLYYIGRIDRTIMLYILIGYLFVFIVSRVLLKSLYRIKKRILDHEELLSSRFVRALTELTVFRTNKRFASEIRKAEEAGTEITAAKVRMRLTHEAFFTLFALLVLAIKIGILFVSWQHGTLTVGAVVALLSLIDRAYIPIAIGNVLYVQYKLDLAAYERLSSFLGLPDDPRLLAEGTKPPIEKGGITLDAVSLAYGAREALAGVSLSLSGGQIHAIVGESGSGKSTVAKLAAGLLLPDSGHILIDGQDLARMDLQYYYDFLAYTAQEAPVFAGTLRENIVFDRPVPDEAVWEALRRVSLGAFEKRLPEGLDTPVGERGMLLSGGERQRIALARLSFTDAPIIILDEATSALDAITEKLVMERLLAHLKGRTVLLIAHRLSAISGVDHIIAMRDGQLVEEGRFETLLERQGYFAALWEAAQKQEGA